MADAPTPILPQIRAIPAVGTDHATLLQALTDLRGGDADWHDARTWSLVYHVSDDHHAFLQAAHAKFFAENALNPMAFKSLKRMEADVVRMSATLLNGDDNSVGTMTSGGTESILMAVKTYRDHARKKRPWIRRPEIVVPRTVHVAFDKAGHYFGVKVRHAPVSDDFRADVKAMKKLINRNTILLVGSAPQYPHGVVDPIEELGALALKKGLPLHVDACVGGFLLPWIEKLGHPMPVFDFRVPGVTSMSADLHKYGFTAKGASVVLYRNMDLLKHQFYVTAGWPGGIYASPSMPGTRPGGPIAAAWAAMQSLGENGYLEQAQQAMQAARVLQDGVAKIAGLQVLGKPHATIVTLGSSDPAIDVYAVADQLEARGWNIDRQQDPPSLHCTVTSNHLKVMDAWLADLQAAVAYSRAHPEAAKSGQAAMYGMMAKIPFKGLVEHGVLQVMEGMYGPDGILPGGDAPPQAGPLMGFAQKYGDRVLTWLGKLRPNRSRKGTAP